MNSLTNDKPREQVAALRALIGTRDKINSEISNMVCGRCDKKVKDHNPFVCEFDCMVLCEECARFDEGMNCLCPECYDDLERLVKFEQESPYGNNKQA